MWALIIDGIVNEVTDINPEGRFHPSLAWIPCSTEVLPGWQYDDGEFSVPQEL
ncbi:hypothetical protein M2O49_000463 [Citrobacter amalonaticus]|nr:hypothetical protein [Citrobacter amalonaticus]